MGSCLDLIGFKQFSGLVHFFPLFNYIVIGLAYFFGNIVLVVCFMCGLRKMVENLVENLEIVCSVYHGHGGRKKYD